MESAEVYGRHQAKKILGYKTFPFPNNQRSQTWSALSSGRNVSLPVHVDDDATVSVVVVVDDQPFSLESPLKAYFCFPEHGRAIALRAGDMLLFNALVPHCISTRVDQTRDMFACALYLKTRVVAGNDNSKSLSKEEQDIVNKYSL